MIWSDCRMGNEHIAACPDDPALFLLLIPQRLHSDIYQILNNFYHLGQQFSLLSDRTMDVKLIDTIRIKSSCQKLQAKR